MMLQWDFHFEGPRIDRAYARLPSGDDFAYLNRGRLQGSWDICFALSPDVSGGTYWCVDGLDNAMERIQEAYRKIRK